MRINRAQGGFWAQQLSPPVEKEGAANEQAGVKHHPMVTSLACRSSKYTVTDL